ncbi:N-acetyltransferase [Nocardioides sp. zg-579]|uniref:N-acetyltransferase n=1 Tax=Nocardioides marmotae TaxID=2663857 RepID=A0A6I3J7S7_9ACTN|nr:GNAT family N-acetyltransferase [Nocardioides marmotae]MCR6030583.1 N-acetyltransferase [Gordonia jinghuaiqii]MTB94219.1 N-acetyltransferase [Nocardioides marmotae]QKE00503.1 N-acetyltransferase [Nocardioides marmotae]
MTRTLTDKSGATVEVTIEIGSQVSSYTVSLADGSTVGRADFVDSPRTGHDRIFFHTEVDEAFGGRGLAGLLVREALADSIRRHVTVVPLCPVFARHLKIHGSEFTAQGGVFRRPTPADFALVTRVARGGA